MILPQNYFIDFYFFRVFPCFFPMKNSLGPSPPVALFGPVPGAVPPRAWRRLREGSAQRGAGVAAAPQRAQRNADWMETAGAAGDASWGLPSGYVKIAMENGP